jgi:epoxyqueuosine reductase
MNELVNSIVNKYLSDSDNFIYGFADLRGLLKEQYKAYGYGISIGKKLDDSILDDILSGPTVRYYDHYKSANQELFQIALNIQSDLKNLGINSLVMYPSLPPGVTDTDEYKKSLKVDISHKMVATSSGLGWIGRTDLFVSHKFGPRLRLTSILIESELSCLNKPVVDNNCGSCSLCVEYCPANAATGDGWSVKMKREDFFDAFKCQDKCTEFSKNINVSSQICGICVSVCPIGQRNYNNK